MRKIEEGDSIDWGFAEALSIGTLLRHEQSRMTHWHNSNTLVNLNVTFLLCISIPTEISSKFQARLQREDQRPRRGEGHIRAQTRHAGRSGTVLHIQTSHRLLPPSSGKYCFLFFFFVNLNTYTHLSSPKQDTNENFIPLNGMADEIPGTEYEEHPGDYVYIS